MIVNQACINFSEIKFIVTDFDGVWTDNKVYTDSHGNETVRSCKYDSLGLKFFREQYNIPILVISSEKNSCVIMRCEKLKIPLINSTYDKVSALIREANRRKVNLANVLFVGNDLNDLSVMSHVGLSVTVADAPKEIKKQSDIVLSNNGGDGAMRELFELFGLK
jgi:YrbI family 3-deoxy-D-manno-octulosonate 8-phosphate phosphatase